MLLKVLIFMAFNHISHEYLPNYCLANNMELPKRFMRLQTLRLSSNHRVIQPGGSGNPIF